MSGALASQTSCSRLAANNSGAHMQRKLYAIYDKVAEDIAGQPVLFKADAPAIRFFEDVYNNNQQISQHPADYSLICIATIGETLETEAHNPPQIVLEGSTIHALRNARPDQMPLQLEA